jgi:L-ribulose-5-phosphate 3-epimerase
LAGFHAPYLPFYHIMNRRSFLETAALASGAGFIPALASAADSVPAAAAGTASRIYLSLKWGMINEPDMSVLDKFKLIQDLGYDGIELDSPGGVNKEEALAASQSTKFPIHGAVNSIHWGTRLSDPSEEVRAKALAGLLTALQETKFVGGDAVLLVPGAARNPENENPEQVWERSIAGIRQALPLASKLGVRILIENVWNDFLYDPKGSDDQGADLLVKYLDEINSPWVGSYFDIGNHQRFGKPAQWIRQLGPRIVKLDVKDWGKNGGFVKIGEGDVAWADVRTALGEIGYTGWATAEVGGGNRAVLAEVLAAMRKNLLGQ